MRPLLKVDFDDTQENWQLWGELVGFWIENLMPRPRDNLELLNQMKAHHIEGANVPGPPRAVIIPQYSDIYPPLKIVLPTERMIKQQFKAVQQDQTRLLPVFYNTAYSGPRKQLTDDQIALFITCRIGEFSIMGHD